MFLILHSLQQLFLGPFFIPSLPFIPFIAVLYSLSIVVAGFRIDF